MVYSPELGTPPHWSALIDTNPIVLHEGQMKFSETNMNKGRLIAADLTIDFDAGIVEKDGEKLVLPDLTWRTLCCLVDAKGAIVTVDELITSVWGDLDITNETVTQRIKLLRRELGDDGQNPRYIGTVRNRGFRFLPSGENQETPAAQPATSSVSPKFQGVLPKALGIAVLVVVVAFTGIWVYAPSPTANRSEGAEAELRRIINRGNEYLSRIQLEDNQLAITLFEQALERDGDNPDALVGLSFALTHNSTKFNYPLEWAKRGETLAQKAIDIESSASAYHALAFALDAQDRRDFAVEYYEKALSLDADNGAVLGSVAYLYQVQGQLARALDYGRKAIALNPSLAFSEVQLASTLYLLERDAEANEWFERGLTLKPDNVFIYSAKTNFMFAQGRFEAALETIDQAINAGVNRPELFVQRGLIDALENRQDDARNSFQLANDVSPTRESGKAYLVWLDMMQGVSGADEKAQSIISDMQDSTNPATLFIVSGLQAGLKNQAAAIEALNGAIDAGYRDWRTVNRHPMFLTLHENPLFAASINRMRGLIAAEK